ncbi:MAG: HAD-IC family P-type ATPase [Micromonosporaceae bacterium]
MILNPGALLSTLAGKLPAGRRQRRNWVRGGRAHIEVKGAHLPDKVDFVRHVEDELARLEGVHWAEVNAIAGRVVVAFDPEQVGVGSLIEVVEGLEEAHDLAAERFPHDRPEHPADVEPLQRQMYAIGADIAGMWLGLARRAVRMGPLPGQLASLVSLVDATPAVRRRLESRLGHPVTDLGLAVGNAVAQGLVQGPFGLMVDVAYRGLLLDELWERRKTWERREPELHVKPGSEPVPALSTARRPAPLPSGPVEAYADRAAFAAIGGAAVAGAVTRDARMMVTATVTATPKAARLGREGFAARLGRDLARSGVLAMDADALRRLDRVDTVVLDAEVLTTGRAVLGAVWVSPAHRRETEEVWLTARALLNPGDPAAVARRDGWMLEPAPRRPAGAAGKAARDLRSPGSHLLALRRHGGLVALVATEPELDPLAAALVASARTAGSAVVAGRSSGVGARVQADKIVAGGANTAASVRALQAEGHAVAVVSARQHEALAAADAGIGVPVGTRPPWGAHLITGPGLADACRILQAVPAARAASRRAAVLAAYGSGAGALLALAGPRAGATARSLAAINGAALTSLASGAWSALALARRPAPLPAGGTDWHTMPADTVLAQLESTRQGLAGEEAERRLAAQPAGPEQAEPGVIGASLQELANPLTPALATGAGLAAASGSLIDAALIATVMGCSALAGGIQRVGAGHALRTLIDKSAVRVRVRRGGAETLTTGDQLVPGDVIIVRPGDAVPADCRVVEAHGLEADESSLTGESQLVTKTADPTVAANVADRRSMLYAGTAVAAGSATATVVAVGPATELGRSAQAAQGGGRPGGAQARLRQLTNITVPVALGAGAALIGAGLLRGRPLARTLGTGVSLAVAAVPEGLPLVATVAQLGAARRLSRRNALVRNPATIEALGRVNVLCFDKTGTLTEGRIRLHHVWAAGQLQPLDQLDADGRLVLAAAMRASPQARDGETLAHATDRAVVDGAAAARVDPGLGTGGWQLGAEVPFEASRGYHAVLGRTPTGQLLTVKGAPETVLPLCSHQLKASGPVPLGDADRQALAGAADRLARRGHRVLAVAERDASSRRDLRADRIERLQFVGLLALTDPVRASAAQAVRGLRAAGVEVLMLTGDHPSTAEAIAAELDLLNGKNVITGQDLDSLADRELDKLLPGVSVFARVSPEHKVRIVAALQRTGRVVAVTGDGANDAPAIRAADVGVALGRRGTNAAKEAADVVVTDDRIETIIDAIVEGRAIWASVRDAIGVLVGGNLGEIAFTVGTGLALPGGSPLNARQLLLVNLLTDMLPAMVLAVRPPSNTSPQALLRQGPDISLGSELTRDIVARGVLTAGAGMGAWLGGRMTGVTRGRAGTIALVGLVGAQLGQTLVAGWPNPAVGAASLVSAAILAGVIQTPGVSQFFGCRPLGPIGWSIGLGASAAASLAALWYPHATTIPRWLESAVR